MFDLNWRKKKLVFENPFQCSSIGIPIQFSLIPFGNGNSFRGSTQISEIVGKRNEIQRNQTRRQNLRNQKKTATKKKNKTGNQKGKKKVWKVKRTRRMELADADVAGGRLRQVEGLRGALPRRRRRQRRRRRRAAQQRLVRARRPQPRQPQSVGRMTKSKRNSWNLWVFFSIQFQSRKSTPNLT